MIDATYTASRCPVTTGTFFGAQRLCLNLAPVVVRLDGHSTMPACERHARVWQQAASAHVALREEPS